MVVRGLVVIGGLVDQPDFDSIVDLALFVVCNSDDYSRVLLYREVAGVAFSFSLGTKKVELGEGLSCFWQGDDIDKGGKDDDDDNDKDDGECLVYLVFLFGERNLKGNGESVFRRSFFPAINSNTTNADDEEQ